MNDNEFIHLSDCAIYNEPAEPNGLCDCRRIASLVEMTKRFADFHGEWVYGFANAFYAEICSLQRQLTLAKELNS